MDTWTDCNTVMIASADGRNDLHQSYSTEEARGRLARQTTTTTKRQDTTDRRVDGVVFGAWLSPFSSRSMLIIGIFICPHMVGKWTIIKDGSKRVVRPPWLMASFLPPRHFQTISHFHLQISPTPMHQRATNELANQ
eukprot:scaffold15332_cov241-Alexandrium_tamarense.AAC.4